MRRTFWKLLIMTLLLVCPLFSAAFGQSFNEPHPEELQEDPWIADVPCKGNPDLEGRGAIGNREFRLCLSFNAALLQPMPSGTSNYSELAIVSYTKRGTANITGLDVSPIYAAEHPGLIIGKVNCIGPERPTGLFSSLREFRVPIQITNQARSDRYPIGVTISVGGDTAGQTVSFSLPVLAPNNASASVDKKPHTVVDCWTGADCSPLELEVRNKLPYKVRITKISISSDDLLQNKPVGDYAADIEPNSPPLDLDLVLKAKRLSLRRVFTGFGRPQAIIRVDFKDSYGRSMSTETTSDLQIRPNVLMITIVLMAGAIFGTWARIDLGRLQNAGVINRRQRFAISFTTFATGILVCVIALFANIKLVVWSDQNSYSAWDPTVIFLTAFVATISGLPILYAYLKLPVPKGTSAGPDRHDRINADPVP